MNQRGFILPSPMLLVGGVAVIFGITTLMFARMYQGAVNDYANYKASVVAQMEQVRIDNEITLAEAHAAVKRNADGWATARADLARSSGSFRVRSDCDKGAVRPATAAGQVADGAAEKSATGATAPAPTEFSIPEAESIIHDAANDAGQVIWLQDYINGIQKAYKK